jgi:hypothetical protein
LSFEFSEAARQWLQLLFSKAKVFDRLRVCQIKRTCGRVNKGLSYRLALG